MEVVQVLITEDDSRTYTVTRVRHNMTRKQAVNSVLAYENRRLNRNGANRWDIVVM